MVSLALPATSLATPGWTPPRDFALPSGAVSGLTRIGYGPGGVATVAFIEIDSISVPIQTVLHVGTIAPGGAYAEQLRVPANATSTPVGAELAVGANGAAVLAYSTIDPTKAPGTGPVTYLAAYRPAGSASWQAAITVASDTTQILGVSTSTVPAVSADGTAAVAVDHLDPGLSPAGASIDVVVRPVNGGWGSPTRLAASAAQSADGVQLGFDAQDNLTAGFALRLGNGRHTLADQRRTASNGLWGTLEDITGSDVTSDAGTPALAVAPDGSAVLAFQYVHYTGSKTLDVNAVTRTGTSAGWTPVTDVAPGGASSAPLAASISPTTDRAYILYGLQGLSSPLDCVGAVRATAGGVFTSPRCVSPTNFSSGSGGVTLLGDDAYFAWSGTPESGTNQVIEGTRWPDASASPEASTDLETPGPSLGFNQLVADRQGSVAVFWRSGNGLNAALRAAAYDAAGPTIVAVIPASAETGATVQFRASAVDLWSQSPGGLLQWSFGDGATGSGGQPTHAYTHPGTYTVTVTAADGLGNTSTSTRQITVTSARPSALAISAVSQSRARWRAGAALPHLARARTRPATPVGTSFRFTLTRAAKVTLAFVIPDAGRASGHRCVSPTRHNRRARHCALAAGALVVSGHAGKNSLSFAGRLSRRARLAAGTYSVTIRAQAAGKTVTAKALRFSIVTR